MFAGVSRTVVASSYMPAVRSGRGVRTYGIVRALAAHGPVDLVHLPFGASAVSAHYADVPGLTLHHVTSSRGPRRAATYGRSRLAGVPDAVARGVSPDLADAAAEHAAEADRVVADDPMAAVALGRLARARPVIYSAHNLESAFRTDWGPRERLVAFERGLLERAAETWMPSPADLAGAARIAPAARLRLVPNVVDVGAIAPAPGPPPEPRALFVADLSYAPNREGLDFLLAEVLPRTWAQAPELQVDIVGRGLDPPPPADPRVRFLGFVDDLDGAYARATCALVPLLRGGGSPLKFVEALAHALPVVATPKAAAGLTLRPGEHYLEGDGPDGFAAAIVRALDPERGQTVGAAGRAVAEREYSIEALVALLTP